MAERDKGTCGRCNEPAVGKVTLKGATVKVCEKHRQEMKKYGWKDKYNG